MPKVGMMAGLVALWNHKNPAERFVAGLLVSLVMLVGFVYLAGHGRYGLFDVDEAIFTEATLEMRQNAATYGAPGLAMPTYNGEPRYHKPPLIYWAQDAAMGVLGESSLYAARLPSALAALMTIALLGFGVWKLTANARWAWASSLAMALNLSFLVVGRAATADGLLNLTSFALGGWVVYMALKPTPNWRWAVTGALAALGMLAKGPIAWFPALIVGLVVLIGRKDRKAVWDTFAPLKSLLVMLVVLAPWLMLLVKQHGLGFFYEFIMVHNIGRYASGLTNTQSSSPFYYIVVVLVGFFPWSLGIPAALGAVCVPLWKDLKRNGMKALHKALAANRTEQALVVLAVVWSVVYVVFFSFSKTKLAHYIVPAYPAFAVLVGWVWAVALDPARTERAKPLMTAGMRWLFGGMVGMLGALMALVFAGIFGSLNPLLEGLRASVLHGALGWLQIAIGFDWPIKDPIAAATLALPVDLDMAPWFIATLLLLAVGPALVGMAWRRDDAVRLPLAMAMAWGTCLALVVWGVIPTIWSYTQAPLARLAAVEAMAPAEVPMIHLGMHKPSVMYLSGKPFLKLEKPLQLPDALIAPETWVMTPVSKVPGIVAELDSRGGGAVLGQRCDGGYCLLNVAKVAAH